MKSSKEFLLDGDDGDVGSATDGRQRQRTDGGSAAALPFHERVNQSGEVVEVRRARERAPRPELITPLRNDGAARTRSRRRQRRMARGKAGPSRSIARPSASRRAHRFKPHLFLPLFSPTSFPTLFPFLVTERRRRILPPPSHP